MDTISTHFSVFVRVLIALSTTVTCASSQAPKAATCVSMASNSTVRQAFVKMYAVGSTSVKIVAYLESPAATSAPRASTMTRLISSATTSPARWTSVRRATPILKCANSASKTTGSTPLRTRVSMRPALTRTAPIAQSSARKCAIVAKKGSS